MLNEVPRKHRVQMSAIEITDIEGFVHSLRGWAIRPSHANDRSTERNFSESGIITALEKGQLIEARPDGRVLMRHDTYCVVANVQSMRVITCWRNSDNDTHASLNLRAYTWRGPALLATGADHV